MPNSKSTRGWRKRSSTGSQSGMARHDDLHRGEPPTRLAGAAVKLRLMLERPRNLGWHRRLRWRTCRRLLAPGCGLYRARRLVADPVRPQRAPLNRLAGEVLKRLFEPFHLAG